MTSARSWHSRAHRFRWRCGSPPSGAGVRIVLKPLGPVRVSLSSANVGKTSPESRLKISDLGDEGAREQNHRGRSVTSRRTLE